MRFSGRGFLLDIEGTTSSISFVYDVMFPYVRRELERFLRDHWHMDQVRQACDSVARDAGHKSLDAWCPGDAPSQRATVCREVERLMDDDVKATGLKQLQGLVWKQGFQSGELKAHLYEDVPPALEQWRASGYGIRIYSSGSVQAQRLFFGHTTFGDLLSNLDGHYDTTTGPKRATDSYVAIAQDFNLPSDQILFISDVTAELDAAHQAGLQTALCRRPGNAAVAPQHGHEIIRSFSEVQLA